MVRVIGGWGEPTNNTGPTISLNHAFCRRVPSRPMHAVSGGITILSEDYHSVALRVRVLRRVERSPVPACPKGVLQGLHRLNL